MTETGEISALRGRLAWCDGDPAADARAITVIGDGLVIVRDGRIADVGQASALLPTLGAGVAVSDHRDSWIVPGFVDCHVHFAQLDVIASYGEQLLDWLERYTYPAERRFVDAEYATSTAELFVAELLRNGTTSALVFATVFSASVDALFEVASRVDMRLAAGKVLMDRNCPAALRDSAKSGYAESRALIERWHGTQRLRYAITPRFAPTSTEAQLAAAGRLAAEFPDVLVQTHLAENRQEIDWVRELFPDARHYLDVYDRCGLVRERAVFAHAIHLCDDELAVLGERGAGVAFCPSSNLFLGSGLFDYARARAAAVPIGFGSDVGGGTRLGIAPTAAEAYKVLQLQRQSFPAWQALFVATLGAARALGFDSDIGRLASGYEADLIVLDPRSTPLMAHRTGLAADPEEELFAMLTLADDRLVRETWVAGRRVYRRA